jgi:hypothetical protein
VEDPTQWSRLDSLFYMSNHHFFYPW